MCEQTVPDLPPRAPAPNHKLQIAEIDNKVVRNRCRNYYLKYAAEQGRNYAMKMAKTVRYICAGFPKKPPMCNECCYILHNPLLHGDSYMKHTTQRNFFISLEIEHLHTTA